MSSEGEQSYDEERLQELEQYKSLQARLQYAEALMHQQRHFQLMQREINED